ncbi:MAG: zinc ABC transporter substrate-binding protein, partial [Candidatus Poseidoniales archaeon]
EHHDEEGEHHDEHDHGEEGLLRAEETIEDAEGCPVGTVISVYHFEEGSYMLEFESEEDMETFQMAMAAMAGAHDHAHDHDDHEDGEHEDGHHHEDGFCYDEEEDTEWSGWDSETMNESDCSGPGLVWIVDDGHGDEDHDEHGVCHDMDTHENHDEYEDQESCEAAGYLWMEDDHDDHEGVCHDEDTHENHDEYEDEESCEAAGYHWMEGDHGDHDDDITPEEALSEFDTNGDGNLSWDEFWVAWNTDDDHDDDHDDHHDDEHHDENSTDEGDETDDDHSEHDHDEEHSPLEEVMEDYMMDLLMPMFNESDADNSGGLSLEELEHFIEDIEAMEDDGADMPTGDYIVAAFDEDGDSMLSYEEFSEMMGMEHDEHHDENETHDENASSEEEFMEAMMEMMFEMYDANSDGSLDATELDMMFEMMDEEEDHHEEGVAFIKLHVETEGEYGIALPAGVSLHVLMDGDHEGHDHGHDDHDEEGHDEDEEGHDEDEEGHDEDEEGHDEEGDHDDHSDEEALAYDPHSWLDPLAFKEQIEVVVGVMSTAFPEGADAFRANADAYLEDLDALDEGFEAAFGENGTCSNNTVASNHNAYAYLAQRYDLEFLNVHGLDPEGEPSAEDIAEVVERIAEDGLTVFFVEEYTNADAVASLVQQTVSDDLPNGVTVLTLYTMETAPMDDSDDYLSLMNKNLENLKSGLGC